MIENNFTKTFQTKELVVDNFRRVMALLLALKQSAQKNKCILFKDEYKVSHILMKILRKKSDGRSEEDQ